MEGLCLASEVSEGGASIDDEECLEIVLEFSKLPYNERICGGFHMSARKYTVRDWINDITSRVANLINISGSLASLT